MPRSSRESIPMSHSCLETRIFHPILCLDPSFLFHPFSAFRPSANLRSEIPTSAIPGGPQPPSPADSKSLMSVVATTRMRISTGYALSVLWQPLAKLSTSFPLLRQCLTLSSRRPALRPCNVCAFFPVESVVDTVSNLAGSPIESLSMQCYEDDVVDVCSALEDFLSLRVERGPEFYDKLTRIDVSVAANDEPSRDIDELEERIEATKRLQELCRDLRLTSVVDKAALVYAFCATIPSLCTQEQPRHTLFICCTDQSPRRCARYVFCAGSSSSHALLRSLGYSVRHSFLYIIRLLGRPTNDRNRRYGGLRISLRFSYHTFTAFVDSPQPYTPLVLALRSRHS